MKLKLTTVCLLLFCFAQVQAKITLPSFFTSNMVLQQKADVNIWGKTSPRMKVMLASSWDKKKYAQWADEQGNFKIKIKTPSFGGPYIIVISGNGAAIKLDNILIGDVWMCSGQSNMEMPLSGWGKINNYQMEVAEANYPNIRLLQVNHTTSNFPSDDVSIQNGGWNNCSPANIPEFSSTAYFFAREVYKKTGIPIGLIHSSWGGTVAEAWTSAESISQIPDFKESLAKVRQVISENDDNKRMELWIDELNTLDLGFKTNVPIWSGKNFDDNTWKQMELPAFFDAKEQPNFDGIVWFRKEVTIPADWANKELTISLGPIDDEDITYFEGYDRERNYKLAKTQVTAGKHVITIRIFDGGSGGGIYGDPARLFIQSGSSKLPLQGSWKYQVSVDLKNFKPKPEANTGANRPTVLYNAMINPFTSLAIRGVIWYQGEANAARAIQYRHLFPALINDWRQKWNQPNLPFYFVQLANYERGEGDASSWPLLRDAQLNTSKLPNTGMAVTIDIGNAIDIHPKNKQDVGKRLALIALAKTYGLAVPYSGPTYQSMAVVGNQIKLNFNFNLGIKSENNELTGFVIAGEDKIFKPAKATIKNGAVFLMNDSISRPVAARYAWANEPKANLTNTSGLPASPFRTDNWQVIWHLFSI